MLASVGITTNSLMAGGAEAQRVALANGLTQHGVQVTMYCLQTVGPLVDDLSGMVDVVVRSPARGVVRKHGALITGTTNTENAFAIRAKSCDANLRWLTVVHNPAGPGAPRLHPFSRIALCLADRVAALTSQHQQALRRHWGLSSDTLLSNSVDIARYRSVAQQREGVSTWEFDIGFLGRLSLYHKGLDLLLRTVAKYPHTVRVGIAGTGPDEGRAKSLAQTLGVESRISWLGHQRPEQFFLRSRSLAVLSRYEGQAMVLLEAAAAGVPVISTTTAGDEPRDGTFVVAPAPSGIAPADLHAFLEMTRTRTRYRLPVYVTDSYDMASRYLAVLEELVPHSLYSPRRAISGYRTRWAPISVFGSGS